MATAHQSLILSAVRADANTEVDTDYPNLLRYCTHKKAERQRVADSFFVGDLSEAKQAITVVTFGGVARGPRQPAGIHCGAPVGVMPVRLR